jgi:NAD-dependent DNA ligase
MNYLSQHLLERRERSDFEVDGIVCMHDAVHPPKKGKNPSHGFAFKSILTHDEAEVTVTDVEWNASKDGYLKPLVRFNPVALGGVTISKATGFNAQYIVANGIAPGALIAVIRSGDVIPHIVRVVVRADPPALPKDVAYVWTDTHVDIKIVERDDAVEVKKMAHFCKTLDIKHVAQKTLQRLYEGGVDTIPKFVAVTVDDIVRLDGFQQTSAERIVQEIERAMKDATTERLMVASNMFGRGLGDKKVSAICAAHKGDLDAMTVESVTQVDGIGEATARTFIQALPAFRAFLRHVGRSATPRHENTRAERNSMNVVFTGFRDKDLEKRIIDMGGSLQSNVTKTTTLVVAKDPSEQSTKLDKARQLGIKIVSKEDMLSM